MRFAGKKDVLGAAGEIGLVLLAFSARRSVWRAISWTIEIFSAIVRMAVTALSTALPLSSASVADWRAIFSVWAALSAFCLMLAAISSIEAEACSAAAACSVAPCDSCALLGVVTDIQFLLL